MSMSERMAAVGRVWQVGALCRAVADTLEARFGAVTVQGEISGFSRAASGHCYFSLKDANGQLRCAMFRRAASLLEWQPREGDLVEVRGRLAVYEARGGLQLVAESMRRAGQGALYEDFLQRKAALEAQGLFDPARKRALTPFPRGIGLVTSLGAAALHDVVSALRRRAPHVPVLLVPAPVQGAAAPAALVASLQRLYHIVQRQQQQGEGVPGMAPIDTILLVRGGGSMEDLWAFNDTQLAHAIVQSPVPLVSGVGHETDVTIADFCADVRAPTPTAAAELAALPAADALQQALYWQQRLQQRLQRQMEQHAQRLDRLAWGLARSSAVLGAQRTHVQTLEWRLHQQRQHTVAAQHAALARCGIRLAHATRHALATQGQAMRLAHMQQRLHAARQAHAHAQATVLQQWQQRLTQAVHQQLHVAQQALQVRGQQIRLLDPHHALERGYALLQDAHGRVLCARSDFHVGQTVVATVRDGSIDLTPLARQQPLD